MALKTDKAAEAPVEMLLIQSKVKDFVKSTKDDARVGEDFMLELNTKVQTLVKDALARCHGNGRQTLKSQDV